MTTASLSDLPSDARIVVLTGAGISRESGLDTFRDLGGVWSRVRLEDVATPQAFARDPAQVHGFYNARRQQLANPTVVPNAAHRALAHLEASLPGRVLVVTQNVDDLHDRAGSRSLIHMHGELTRMFCLACNDHADAPAELSTAITCAACGTAGGLRPDIVWFGEMPYRMEEIGRALADCDLFVSIGTSGTVYPAAGFVAEASMAGAHTVELNLEPSDGFSRFAERRYGPATEIVPGFVEELLVRLA